MVTHIALWLKVNRSQRPKVRESMTFCIMNSTKSLLKIIYSQQFWYRMIAYYGVLHYHEVIIMVKVKGQLLIEFAQFLHFQLPPTSSYDFRFFFCCLSAQRMVMSMMIIPLPHSDNFGGIWSWQKKKKKNGLARSISGLAQQ